MKIRPPAFRVGKGFSFPEILITIVFLVVGLVFLVRLFTTSTRGTADVYMETIALSLAYETLEWLSAFSFEDLQQKEIREAIDKTIGLDRFRPVTAISLGNNIVISYPDDYQRFERMVVLETKGKTTVITVMVSEAGPQISLFRREVITLQRLVAAEYE